MMPSRLQISHHTDNGLAVVELAGDLDLPGATRLMGVLSELAGSGSRVVVGDLSRLAVPELLRLLLVFPAAQRRGGPWPQSSIHLAVPAGDLADRLRRLGMPRFLPMHTDLDDALTAAGRESPAVHCDLALGAEPSSPGTARAAMARLWPTSRRERDVRQDGLVVVSELTSNAVRHAGGPFTVSMALSAQRFAVGVTDDSRQEPVLLPAATAQTGGRGMHLVASLSKHWGVRLVHDYSKTVWATLDRPRSVAGLKAVPTLKDQY
jgi:hypothetical protein